MLKLTTVNLFLTVEYAQFYELEGFKRVFIYLVFGVGLFQTLAGVYKYVQNYPGATDTVVVGLLFLLYIVSYTGQVLHKLNSERRLERIRELEKQLEEK